MDDVIEFDLGEDKRFIHLIYDEANTPKADILKTELDKFNK